MHQYTQPISIIIDNYSSKTRDVELFGSNKNLFENADKWKNGSLFTRDEFEGSASVKISGGLSNINYQYILAGLLQKVEGILIQTIGIEITDGFDKLNNRLDLPGLVIKTKSIVGNSAQIYFGKHIWRVTKTDQKITLTADVVFRLDAETTITLTGVLPESKYSINVYPAENGFVKNIDGYFPCPYSFIVSNKSPEKKNFRVLIAEKKLSKENEQCWNEGTFGKDYCHVKNENDLFGYQNFLQQIVDNSLKAECIKLFYDRKLYADKPPVVKLINSEGYEKSAGINDNVSDNILSESLIIKDALIDKGTAIEIKEMLPDSDILVEIYPLT